MKSVFDVLCFALFDKCKPSGAQAAHYPFFTEEHSEERLSTAQQVTDTGHGMSSSLQPRAPAALGHPKKIPQRVTL